MNKVSTALGIGILLIANLLLPVTSCEDKDPTGDIDCYGFIIEVTPDQRYSTQTYIARLINELLHNKTAAVHWIASDGEARVMELGKMTNETVYRFNKGSFLVSFGDNLSKNIDIVSSVYRYNSTYKLRIYMLTKPLDNIVVHTLSEPKIAYYAGPAMVNEPFYYLLKEAGFQNQKNLTPDDVIRELTIDNYNVIIWGGGYPDEVPKILADLISIRGLRVRQKIREFVRNGGGYVGCCYGGWRAASRFKRPLGLPLHIATSQLLNLLPLQLGLLDCSVYRALPGAGDVTLKIVNTDHPLAFGLPEFIKHHSIMGGPMFLSKTFGKSNMEVIGVIHDVEEERYWNWDFCMEFCPWWVNPFLSNETKMKIARRWMQRDVGAAVWVTGRFGKGKVVAFGGHPECTDAWDRSMTWGNPPRIVYNTIFYLVSTDPHTVDVKHSVTISRMGASIDPSYIECYTLENITLQGSVRGGNPPYIWCWYLDGKTIKDVTYSNTQSLPLKLGKPGNYGISLIVVDNDHKINVAVAVLSIRDKPKVKMLDPLYAWWGCWGIRHGFANIMEVSFDFDVLGGFSPYRCHWDFGDNTSADTNSDDGSFYIRHRYTEAGIYRCTATVYDKHNSSAVANFVVAINDWQTPLTIELHQEKTHDDDGEFWYGALVDVPVTFTVKLQKSKSGPYVYNFSFGDGTFYETPPITENVSTVNHTYTNFGTYFLVITVKDENGNTWKHFDIIPINNLKPPEKPKKPSGPIIGLAERWYSYSTTVVDSDGDKLLCLIWDFGDEKEEVFYGWEGPTFWNSHRWKEPGVYQVRVRAMDIHGGLSDWSDPLKVYIFKLPRLDS